MSTEMRVGSYSADLSQAVHGAPSIHHASDVQDAAATAKASERKQQQSAQRETAETQTGPETLSQYVEQLKDLVPPSVKRELQFSIDKDSGRMVVKIVDMKSGETIRQMPSEELLKLQQALDRHSGLLLNVTA